MTSQFFSKKSLLICGFFISCIIGWCIQPLGAMAVVTQLVSITSQTLQQIALFVGTAFCYAKHYQKDSLIGQLLARNSHAESAQVSHIKEESPVNLVASIESARHEIALKQHDITAAYALPQIKVFERIKNSTSDAGVYASLHKLMQEPSRVVQEQSAPAIKQFTAEEARRLALTALGTSSAQMITKQIEQRMALQSRLGLMNFKGIVLSAGESHDGHFTYYVGLREKRSCELHADVQTAKWKLRQQIMHILATDLDYRNYVYNQYKTAIDWMLATNEASVIARVRARLMLPALIFEGNNWEEFYYAAHKIQTYLFDRNGALCPIGRINAIPRIMHDLMQTVKKTWPTIYEGIDAERTKYLHKNEVDDPWALWFAPSIVEFSSRILKNPENKLLLRVIDACEQGDLILAHRLLYQAKASRMYNAEVLAQQIIQEAKSLLCDEYGIYKCAQADPLYKVLSEQEKAHMSRCESELAKINESFLLRHTLKTKFEQAWQIPQNAPPAVHEAIYKLLNDNALALANVPVLIDKIIELTADYKNPHQQALLQAFFLPNGVLKDFAHYDRAKSLSLPISIFDAEHIQLRRVLNNLLYIEHAQPGTEQAIAAGKIIECIQKRFSTQATNLKTHDLLIVRAYRALIHKDADFKTVLIALQEAASGAQGISGSSSAYMPMPDPQDPKEKQRKEFLKILEESQELKELEKRVQELWQKLEDTKTRSKMPNSMNVNDFAKVEALAKFLFEEIRKMTFDVAKIARNTGIPEKIIQAIKDHVFYEKHILFDGIQRFCPNIDMAEAWLRLIEGNFVRSDLMLLLHEFAESLIMRGIEVSYDDAHPVINKLYNWHAMLVK